MVYVELAINWFRSYLRDRKLQCKINTVENGTIRSDVYNISHGTAQGSCLGPLLFILFTNDIHTLPLLQQANFVCRRYDNIQPSQKQTIFKIYVNA